MPVESASDSAAPSSLLAARIGLVAGPVAAVAAYFALKFLAGAPPGATAEEAAAAHLLSPAAQATAAIGVLMAIWWMTEALPLEATALLPLFLLPLLGMSVVVSYVDQSIFLFLGGFLLALAVQKWGLHRRLALLTLTTVGTRPSRLVGGFMLATAGVSMWVSNTATTLMMLPIGLSVVHLLSDKLAGSDAARKTDAANFAVLVLLGIAYAASIGGFGTLIGTPPNALFKGFMEQKGIPIEFGRWMLFAVPICAVYLALAWAVMTKWLFPVSAPEIRGGHELIEAELAELGRMSRGEWIVLAVFAAAVAGWISLEPLYQSGWLAKGPDGKKWISDAVVAMAAALVLFIIPVEPAKQVFALDWRTALRVPWGVLILFGGGLSLASAMKDTKLDQWIGEQVTALSYLPFPVLIVLVVTGVVLFSELASNLATAATLLPVLFAAAEQLGLHPLVLCVPAILAASCGFMLPVATPPNAIVFGTGHITMRQMMRAGLWLDLIGIVLIPLGVWLLGGIVLGGSR